mmetsp:Transcript_9853/g.28946  ORF Transcript_9853/g.28946 Transcript_9853/m.28946 type:complete len:483 (-) Transcript_9853:346-1794(-)|eukprot:CAMPEP_0206046016 /NCGR_PEP_ID=MMETSP1466-20131121/17509_1 /ASSEMBLY_ACC=CAM_ASM_001126 /TAXON_ID=44452 /ORGANISM="Pavlova gyrans, Strain CCMP608" /LENGTH=482 /DNA_ID=CAMNT_0053420979 /DNA_START=31 /DNA_END=1479 /DNA_ORIENTATION=-
MGIGDWLDNRFKVTERGSTLGTEFRAGTVTFMTMAYILLVNPTILAGAGMPFRQVASATALSAIVGCTFVGLVANLPFGLGPGMGLNAYFAYGVCVANMMTFDVALTAVLIEGVVFALLTICGASSFIQKIMPHNLKHAITVGIGLFQAFIGFRMTGLVVPNEETLVALGNIHSIHVLLGLATTILIAVLTVRQVQGAMLIGVVTSSLISWCSGLHPLPHHIVESPTLEGTFNHFNFTEYIDRWHETVPITLAFLFVALFDTAGVQFGAGLQAGLVDPVTHTLPGSTPAFLSSALATIFGALTGTSPVIIANETCAGIADGGRTGLTALVIAFYFALSILFIPIFSAVPPTATAPALIIVGALMMGPAGVMDWENFNESFPAYLTIAVMPLTYSIANGVVAGLVTYCAIDVFTRPWWKNGCGRGGAGQEDDLSQPLTARHNRRASGPASPHAVCRPSAPVDSAATRNVEIRPTREGDTKIII